MDVQLKAQGQKRWILVQLVVGMWRRYRFAHFFHLYSGDGNSNTTSSFQLPVWTLSLWTLLVDGAQNTPGSWWLAFRYCPQCHWVTALGTGSDCGCFLLDRSPISLRCCYVSMDTSQFPDFCQSIIVPLPHMCYITLSPRSWIYINGLYFLHLLLLFCQLFNTLTFQFIDHYNIKKPQCLL